MRASIFLPAFAAAVFAQESSVDYMTQTNSLGVVTGQPKPETSIPTQPAVATSIAALPPGHTTQPNVATIPNLGTGVHTITRQGQHGPNSTETIVVSSNNSTMVISTVGPSSSSGEGEATRTGPRPSGTNSEGSPTEGGSTSQSTGAAATMGAVVGSVAGIGAFMAAFL